MKIKILQTFYIGKKEEKKLLRNKFFYDIININSFLNYASIYYILNFSCGISNISITPL